MTAVREIRSYARSPSVAWHRFFSLLAVVLLTCFAQPALSQVAYLQGTWNGQRVESPTPPTLPANSSQTITMYQVPGSSSVVGTMATYWPGTPYYWQANISGTLSGSTLSLTWTPGLVNLPAGDTACAETQSLPLTTSGGVTTATVAAYHPCGQSYTIASYPFTLNGWQKQYGTQNPNNSFLTATFSVPSSSIDASTGNIVSPTTDYETAGPNKLALVRYYNAYQTLNRLPVLATTYVMSNVPNISTNFDRGLTINALHNQVTAYRGDGQQLTFNLVSGVWVPDSDVDMTLVGTGPGTWTLTTHDDTVETYTMAIPGTGYARLNTIEARNGYTQTLAYNGSNQPTSVTDSYGRTLTFTYTGGYLTSVTTPDSTVISYTYSSTGINPGVNDRIATVSFNTSPVTSRTYNYTNASFPFYTTSITDENGNTYESWTYDTYGRALTDTIGTGANANVTTMTYNDSAGTTTVTNALGQQHTYTFGNLQGGSKPLKIQRVANAPVTAATETFTYDSNGYPASATDWKGNLTTYVNDAHGDPTTIVEASGTTSARTTTIAYDTTWVRLPATVAAPLLTTGFTYDTNGNPLTEVLTDTTTQTIPYSTNGQTRTWHYTWSNFLPLTVQTPNGNTTTFTFDTTGALTNIQDALHQNTAITSHTGGGLPLTITDPNSVTTTLTYSARNWLLTSSVATGAGPLTMTNTYDAVGNLTKVQQPDGSYLTNTYDTAHRLTKVADSFGNSINYTLDALGDRTASNIENPSSTVTRAHSATFDTLGRTTLDSGPFTSQNTAFTYDSNSNIASRAFPHGAYGFYYTYDPLNRPLTESVFNWGETKTTYDPHDSPLTFVDRNGNTTSYVYDGFGDVIQQTSPDTGTTVAYYDIDGNVTQKVDALSVITNFTYDALDRVLTTSYPADTAENVAYTYDQTGTGFAFGIGRLTSLTDTAGSLTRTYDERGNLLSEKRVSGGTTLATSYTYDAASRVLTTTYPSGAVLTYTRDAMGRITAASATPSGGSATTLASSIAYEPFGPWTSLTNGNGIVETVTRDADYRLTNLADVGSATVQSLAYTLADTNFPTAVTDGLTSTNTVYAMAYDSQYRLSQYTVSGGAATSSVVYDNNSNRTSSHISGAATTYTLNPSTNQLKTIAFGGVTNTLTTNADGNITAFSPGYGTAGVTGLSYNNANRLTSVSGSGGTLGSYVYDAFGQRFSKTAAGATTLFQYSGSALLAEIKGGTEADYFYVNGRPLAMLTGSTFTWLNGDANGTPRVATNASQTVVWKASYLPFGETNSTSGSATVNLRMPGQYYDAESGFSQNGFRDYVPAIGRYLEADPLGVSADQNVYGYAGGNPFANIDPLGLDFWNGKECLDHIDDRKLGKGTPNGKSAAECTRVGGAQEAKKYHLKHSCNNTQVLSFIHQHQADATTVAQQLNIPPAFLLGLSGRESQWGTGRFAQWNAFFNTEVVLSKKHHGEPPNYLLPYSNGWAEAQLSNQTFVAEYPNYLAAAEGFAAKYGNAVADTQDPSKFLSELQTAHFNSHASFTDPEVLYETSQRMSECQ